MNAGERAARDLFRWFSRPEAALVLALALRPYLLDRLGIDVSPRARAWIAVGASRAAGWLAERCDAREAA